MERSSKHSVIITQYKWAGSWGPFKIRSHCEECDLTTHNLRALIEREFNELSVVFEIQPWLDNAWFCLKRGAWHPPIIMINGRLFFQFSHRCPLFDREKLKQTVLEILGPNKPEKHSGQ